MRSRRRARINGLSFVEWPHDHHGTWHVLDRDGIKGVWEGVDVRREDTPRPLAHGSFDAPVFLASRVIPVSGHVSTRSGAELVHEMNRLTGLLAGGGTGRLSLEDDTGTTFLDVRLGAATQVTQLDDTTARFLVTFWAADPRRYGETHTFAAGVPAVHYGNFPASPVIEVTGSMPSGYTVSAGGKSFVVAQALTAGQTHRIDMETGWVYRDGALQTGAVGAAELWTVPPGQRLLHTLTPVSGSGLMTVTTIDTYI